MPDYGSESEYVCEIFIIKYYPCTPDQYDESEDPPSSVEIIACIDGDVQEKIERWAKEFGYTIDSWENPIKAVRFIEMVL